MSERKTLTIGCKLPSGLKLEIGKPHDPGYKSAELNGANQGKYTGRADSGRIFVPTTEHGYGLTQIDSELWGEWKKRHKVNAEKWLRDGVLFVVEDKASAQAAAADGAEVVTGFEQLNPDKLPQGLENRAAGE
jgi:hypothetical protein